ncbi:hypothetical protein ACI6TZ_001541 [Neisseria gonorrhoeae]
MAYINILAGDFHKGKAVLKKDCIVLSRGGKVALLDIAGYEVQDGGVIEVVFFDGRRMLVEKNDAFLQAVKVALYNEPQNPEERRQQYNQRQVNSAAKAKKAKKIKLIVGGIFVLLFVAMCAVPKKELTPEQDKKIDSSAVISQCDEAIKAQLNHPRTFDPHILDTATGVNQNGNVLVTRGFTAKNGLGMQIDYRAYCVITDNKVEVSIEQK